MAARLPRPGGPVRGSATGRPLMAAMDLLGRRWALRIVWELRAGPLGARALQARCDQMSSSVLYERLDELTAAGLLARDKAGAYLLTGLGRALAPALESLDSWARRWAQALQQTEPPAVISTPHNMRASAGPPGHLRGEPGAGDDIHPGDDARQIGPASQQRTPGASQQTPAAELSSHSPPQARARTATPPVARATPRGWTS